ncbi:hypothetical protein [Bacterioplanoides sp.]|uniref:hypothetical protein n=1 Tax=Bacterioplanoides sp. TaxID=2066072 RepID=UPI003B5A7C81
MNNMQFPMPVTICGAMSFQPDNGNRINQIFVVNSDPDNPNYKGTVPAKMACDQVLFDQLPTDQSAYPMDCTILVRNKTAGGKTVQHALTLQQTDKKAKAS